jgi:hypothetical protein
MVTLRETIWRLRTDRKTLSIRRYMNIRLRTLRKSRKSLMKEVSLLSMSLNVALLTQKHALR